MEPKTAFFTLTLMGVVACMLDFLGMGLFVFFYLGVSWIIAGIIYGLADREITEWGFLAALFLGLSGAIIWVVIDTSRKGSGVNSLRSVNRQAYYRKVAQEGYKCGNCFWFGKPGCPRSETLINAEPCENFMI